MKIMYIQISKRVKSVKASRKDGGKHGESICIFSRWV